jgi:DMSO/TMAO reductase YedYZ heme-binding membrane subunit
MLWQAGGLVLLLCLHEGGLQGPLGRVLLPGLVAFCLLLPLLLLSLLFSGCRLNLTAWQELA